MPRFVLYDRLHLSPYIGFLVAGGLLFVFGYVTYLLVLRPLPGQESFMVILVTIGLSIILVDASQLVFGADYHQINIPLQAHNIHLGTASRDECAVAGIVCNRTPVWRRRCTGS